jgi:hypothetical protein
MLEKLPLPTAKTLLRLLRNQNPEEATEAFAAFVALQAQRLEDANIQEENWARLKDDLRNFEGRIAEVLLGIIQQRLFQASRQHDPNANCSVMTERRNAWNFVSHLVHYVSRPGGLRSTGRSVRSMVRYELWTALGWVYFAEVAYFLVRWRQRSTRIITGKGSTEDRWSTTDPLVWRDAEATYLMRWLLPKVLRYVPSRTWAVMGVSLPDPVTQPDAHPEQPMGAQEALCWCHMAHVAWRHPELLLEGSPRPNRWDGTPTHEWFDELLLGEQMLLRPWMMPAITATSDDSTVVEDALIRETDRTNFEAQMLCAMAELRLCTEWFVPGPLYAPVTEQTLAAERNLESPSSTESLRQCRTFLTEFSAKLDGSHVPARLRTDEGAVLRLCEAIRGRPLSSLESGPVLNRVLNVERTLLHRLNLDPAELLLFHERHLVEVTARIVRHLIDTGSCRLPEYLEALASLPITVSNLSLICAVDRSLLFRLFVSRVCSRWRPSLASSDVASARLVELFAIFIQRVLNERPTWIANETAVELETWSLAASRMKSATRLYRSLRMRRIEQRSESPKEGNNIGAASQ